MRYFEVIDGKKVVSNHLKEPKYMAREDWTQLFTELGFKVENQKDLEPDKYGRKHYIDNFLHSQDEELQLGNNYLGSNWVWAIKSKEKGEGKNKEKLRTKGYYIVVSSSCSTDDFNRSLRRLLKIIRSQY
jgi:hypothetical protein